MNIEEDILIATPFDTDTIRAELRVDTSFVADQRTAVGDNKTPQKTFQQLLEEKLKTLKNGESISGDELAKIIGEPKISAAISKITRVDETTFNITRTFLGKGLINDSPIKIEKTTLEIGGNVVSVYRVQIGLKGTAKSMNIPPDFYVFNNRMYFYKDGKLYYYDETTK